MPTFRLYNGNCGLQLFREPDDSIDSVVTDPPYGLKFMGKKWDYQIPSIDKFEAILRVMKPGAHMLCFGGPRTYHRMTCAVEDAGFEIRDCLSWVYGSGFPKSLDVGGGHGTALKPAWEPIILARKPFKGTVASNVLAYGTGAINIDGCRIGDEVRHNSSAYVNKIYGLFKGPEVQGRNVKGRWPANFLHDGSDEVLGLFPITKSGSGVKKKASGLGANIFDLSKVDGEYLHGDSGSAARYFYCAKASKADRGAGNKHPTVKPTTLMRWLCRLVTPAGGTVLDPFCGSGSTGKAAILEGFNFCGVDIDKEHLRMAELRCEGALLK